MLNQIIDAVDKALCRPERQRDYLGASQLGQPCSRAIQYQYMGIKRDYPFSAEQRRIFAIGHHFEDLIKQWLQQASFVFAKQGLRFSALDGRFKGHVDGVIVGSQIDLPVPVLWECKTLKASSWRDLKQKGLSLSKPIYAAQIALYQAYLETNFPRISNNPALFTALNKDTAELYYELVPFDPALAQSMSDKAVNIIRATEADEVLPRIASSSDFYQCKYCPFCSRCWEGAL